MTLTEIASRIRDIPDFPKPGIIFKDISPLLGDGPAFSALVDQLCEKIPAGTTKLAVVESRGFLLGSAMAARRGLGMALVRKPGKLPFTTHSHAYDLEYGQDILHMHIDALTKNDRVCIVDDVLATGGTAAATEALCLKTGANVTGFVFMLELMFLNGRSKLQAPTASLIPIT